MSIFDYESEEEQIAAIKNWWKENWFVTVAAVGLSLAGYFGVNYFKDSRDAHVKKASYIYDSLVDAGDNADNAAPLAEELKADFPESQYAHFAAFTRAKAQVDAGDYAAAAKELRWVLDNKPDALTQSIAQLRLARVHYQLGELDQALALLAKPATGFEASYLELQGDIYREQGDVAQARDAYQAAIEALAQAGANDRPYLQYKLDDLAAADA